MLRPPPSPGGRASALPPGVPSSPRPAAQVAESAAHRDPSRYSLPSPSSPHQQQHAGSFSSHFGGGAGAISTASSFDSVRSSYSATTSPRVGGGDRSSLFKRPPPSVGRGRPLPGAAVPPAGGRGPVLLAGGATTAAAGAVTSTTTTPAFGVSRPALGTSTTGGLRSRSPSPSRFKLPPDSPRALATGGGSRSGSPALVAGGGAAGLSPSGLSPRTGATAGGSAAVPGPGVGAPPTRMFLPHTPVLPSLRARSSAESSTPALSAPGSSGSGAVQTPLRLAPRSDEVELSLPRAAQAAPSQRTAAAASTAAPHPATLLPSPPPPSDLPPPLPEGWEELQDPSSGRFYYHHAARGVTTWERPGPPASATTRTTTAAHPVPPEASIAPAVAAEEEEGSARLGALDESAPAEPVPAPAPPAAASEAPEQGGGASSTSAEDASASAADNERVDENRLPKGWREVVDPASGQTYYYHEIDQVTSWERPGRAPEEASSSAPVQSESEEGEAEHGSTGTRRDAEASPAAEEPTPTASATAAVGALEPEEGAELPKLPEAPASAAEAEAGMVDVAVVGPVSLPAGWQECLDPQSGQVYFFHLESNVTTWERPVPDTRPEAMQDDGQMSAGVMSLDNGGGADGGDAFRGADYDDDDDFGLRDDYAKLPLATENEPGPDEPPQDDGAQVEREASAASLDPVESSHDRREAVEPLEVPADSAMDKAVNATPAGEASVLSSLPEGWQEMVDESSGRTFFFHEADGITTWDRPDGHTAQAPPLEGTPGPEEPELQGLEEPPQESHDKAVPVEAQPNAAPDTTNTPESKRDNPLRKSLPDGWQELIDKSSGMTYYFHEADGSTSWDLPESHVAQESGNSDAEGPSVCDLEPEGDVVEELLTDKGHVLKESLPEGWEEMYDEATNQTYYFNANENTTTWERPALAATEFSLDGGNEESRSTHLVEDERSESLENTDAASSPLIMSGNVVGSNTQAQQSQQAPLPEGWEEVIDPSSGQVYYFHSDSDTTSWDRPMPLSGGSIATVTTLAEDLPVSKGESENDKVPSDADFKYQPLADEEVSDSDGRSLSLPEGWQVLFDDATGQVYYFHEATDVTTWDPPTERSEQPQANVAQELSVVSEDEPVEAEVPVAPEGETGASASDGKLDEVESAASIGGGGTDQPTSRLPDGWQAVLDETSGLYYYVNELDGTTSWELPLSEFMGSESRATEPPAAAVQPEVVEHPTLSDGRETVVDDGRETVVDDDTIDKQYINAIIDTTSGELPMEEMTTIGSFNSAVAPEIEHEEDVFHNDAPELQVEEQQIEGDTMVHAVSGRGLPPGWEELIDEASGQVYYYCEAQQISSWERPTVATSDVQDDRHEAALTSHDDNVPESAPEETAAAPLSSSFLPDGWSKVSDESPYAQGDFANLDDEQKAKAPAPISEDWVDVQGDDDQVEVNQSENQQEMDTVSEVPPEWTESGAPQLDVATITVTNESVLDELLPGWVELVDPTTMLPYYFNEALNETTWDRPVAVDSAKEDVTRESSTEELSSVQTLPDGWEEMKDPSTERLYYYNAATGETTWDRPRQQPQRNVEQTRRTGRPAHSIATFGFGGRVCVLTCTQNSFSRMTIHRTCSLLVTDPIVGCERAKLQHNVSGCLASANATAVLSYLTERSSGAAGMLLKLVSIAASGNGKLRSDRPVDDPQSPESAVVKLLAPNGDARNGGDTKILAGKRALPTDSDLLATQNLVVRGEKEQAAKEAASKGSFGLSLLLASMCGPKVFEEAIANFAQSALLAGSPLYTAAMLFSGQVKPTRSMWGTDLELLRVTWRYHLSVLLSVRSKGWDHFAVSLGDTLKDLKEVEAAHVCYLVCGCPIASPARQDSRLTLIGCEVTAKDLTLTTTESVEAFEITEAYEWARLQSKSTAWIECLQPFKLVYAMLLADYGFEQAASTYIPSIKAFAGNASAGRFPESLALAILSCDRESVADSLAEFESRLTRASTSKTALQTSPPQRSFSNSKGMAFPSSASPTQPSDSSFGSSQRKQRSLGVEASEPPLQPLMTGPAGEVSAVNSHEMASTLLDKPPLIPMQPPPMIPSSPMRIEATPDSSGLAPATEASAAPTVSTPRVRDTRPPLQTPAVTAETPSSDASQKAPKPRSAPMSAPANLQQSSSTPSSSSKKKGFFSFGIRDRMTKWLNPDATQADLGEGMQAYYDEKLKVWVFPGEDPAEVAKPIGPPPTTPLAASATPADPSAPPASAATPSNDPLAAMMAPPKRAPSAFQNKSRSAGAAMTSTPHRLPIPGMVLPGEANGAGRSGAPPAIMTQPPMFAVFTPSPAAGAAT